MAELAAIGSVCSVRVLLSGPIWLSRRPLSRFDLPRIVRARIHGSVIANPARCPLFPNLWSDPRFRPDPALIRPRNGHSRRADGRLRGQSPTNPTRMAFPALLSTARAEFGLSRPSEHRKAKHAPRFHSQSCLSKSAMKAMQAGRPPQERDRWAEVGRIGPDSCALSVWRSRPCFPGAANRSEVSELGGGPMS